MKRLLIALSTILLAATTQAHTADVYLHGLSYHYVNRYEQMNEANLGLSLKWENDLSIGGISPDWIQAGFYENTFYNTSVFVLTGYEHDINDDWQYGYGVGAVTGYEYASVLPVAGAFVEYRNVQLAVLPAVVTLSVKFNIDF